MKDEPARDIEEILAAYVDRLNDGERLDEETILAEDPVHGPEIFEHLEAFIESTVAGDEDRALGTLGNYVLRRQIGRGGMGVVYDAWQTSLDRHVALKVLPVGLAADDRAFQRFMREAKTAARLSHPHVVAVFGMGIESNTPYYAMEHVEGETLAQILAQLKEAQPESATVFGKKDHVAYFMKVAEAFAEVAEGLQHAHSKGVVHRDIKPSNLIRDTEGRLRILDFGLARLEGQESLTASGDFLGTPLYMSPEQAQRRRISIDHRTDVYSLGTTLYETLTGRPPFRGKDHQDTLSRIIERDPVEPRKLNARIPRDLETIVLKCLRKEPSDRYGTAEALTQDLRRFVRGDPIEARPELGWDRFRRLAVRHRVKLVGASVALVLLVGCAVMAWFLVAAQQREALTQRQEARTRYESRVVYAAMKLLHGEMLLGSRSFVFDPRLPTHEREGFDEAGRLVIKEVVDELELVIGRVADPVEGLFYRARGLRRLSRGDEAIIELEKLLDIRPGFVAARMLRDKILEKKGRTGRSSQATPEDDDWGVTWMRTDRAMRLSGLKWEEAAAAYGKLIELEEKKGEELYLGSSLENYLGRGIAWLESGNIDDAKDDFHYVRGLSDKLWGGRLVEPLLLLGKAHHLNGQPARAEGWFQRALDRFQDDNENIRLWIAAVCTSSLRSLVLASRFEEAVEAGRKAMEYDPRDPTARVELGFALLGLLHTRHGDKWGKLGQTGEPSAEFEELVRLAEKAVRLDRGHLAYALLSDVREAQGRLEESRELSEKAESLLRKIKRSPEGSSDLVEATVLVAPPTGGDVTKEPRKGSFGNVSRVRKVNSPFNEWSPCLSTTGLELYFSSNRPGGPGGYDLYVARRDDLDRPWGIPVLLSQVNSKLWDRGPAVCTKGLRLYFSRQVRSGSGGLYVAVRGSTDEPFGGASALKEINTEEFAEFFPSITEDGRELYFTSDQPRGTGSRDIWMAWRHDATELFNAPRPLAEINSRCDDGFASLSRNGLALFWSGIGTDSHNCTKGSSHIWFATRERRWDAETGEPARFGNPRRLDLGEFPDPFPRDDGGCPGISPLWPEASSELFFVTAKPGRSRPVGGDFDIVVATWTWAPGPRE